MPTVIPETTLSEALRWRYATQDFDPSRRIPAATWAVLEEALVLSPSSFGLQPWRFVVVTEAATREKLSAAAYDQRQPLDCSHFVVFAARKGLDDADVDRHVARTAEVTGTTVESLKGFEDSMKRSAERARAKGTLDEWAARQVYIALGQFMAAAAVIGVDTCPMEGINKAKFDEILGLTAMGYTAICAGAAGYRAASDKYATQPKVRFRPEDVIVRA